MKVLCVAKPQKDLLLLRTKGDEESPFALSREHLNRSLNAVLKKASEAHGKHIRTHSFRINLADRIINQKGLIAAQKVLGHKSINTTIIKFFIVVV